MTSIYSSSCPLATLSLIMPKPRSCRRKRSSLANEITSNKHDNNNNNIDDAVVSGTDSTVESESMHSFKTHEDDATDNENIDPIKEQKDQEITKTQSDVQLHEITKEDNESTQDQKPDTDQLAKKPSIKGSYVHADMPLNFGNEPIIVTCPVCDERAVTKVTTDFKGCPFLKACIPCIYRHHPSITHSCSKCNTVLRNE